ncbi:MAG TPA: LysR family transcriptional regulator [Acidimicrobiales bacterium]|nr:LysR family transcriptional regulator [Acidimicrobiales bacterium]
MEQDSMPDPAVDLDLRKLRYFIAVAEEMHFGRAAERLYVAQPALSRQIQRLEEQLGVALFARTSRSVELTDAGRKLLSEGKALLAAAQATQRRVRRAAERARVLTVGFFTGDPVTPATRAFGAAHPDVVVDVVRVYWFDQADVLFDGRADVAFVHLPVAEAGLRLVPLYDVARVALLSRDHPLARRGELSIAELADEPVILHRGASPAWERFHNTDPRPDGRHPSPGPLVGNIEEKLEQVAAGRAISFLPVSAAAAMTLQPEVVVVPVTDIAPTRVCLAWSVDGETELVRTFVELASGAVRSTGPGFAGWLPAR